MQLRPFGKQTHRREDIKLPHGYLGDCVGFFHYPAVAVVTKVTYWASGIHWPKVSLFCYLCFLTALGVITAAKNVISHSILFLALLLKEKDLDYVSIQDPKVAVLLLPGSTFNLVAHQNVPCTVWVGGGGSGADVVWVQVPRSRPSQIWYQLDKHGSHRHTHSHRSSFRWN